MNPLALKSLGELHDELLLQTKDTAFKPSRRIQLAVASFAIVRDHHLAIAVLIESGLHASAFALMRPLFEAAAKGMWLSHCAAEAKLEAYAGKTEVPAVGELIDDLLNSSLPEVVSTNLRCIKKRYWKTMSSLTHAGQAQLSRWIDPTGVKATYTEAEVAELESLTAFVVLTAALERERLGNNARTMAGILALLPKTIAPET
jgi:hypothetical protein